MRGSAELIAIPVAGLAAFLIYGALRRKPAADLSAADQTAPREAPPTITDSPIAHETASSLAVTVADDIRNNRSGYDHNLLQTFQRAAGAGLVADGLYGPATARVLKSYVPDAPDALPEFTPAAVSNQTTDAMVGLAQEVADDVTTNGTNYDHDLVQRFQRAAGGLVVDGIYGPKTAARVTQVLGADAPAPPDGAPGFFSVVGTGAWVHQANLVHAIHGEPDPMQRRKMTAAFQRAEKMPVHGQLDRATVEAMTRYY
jgi:hypothetical protein